MLLSQLADTSRRVAGTRSRRDKIDALADCLRALGADERAVGAAFVSGEPRQGRIGLGPALIFAAMPEQAPEAASLTLADVDATLTQLAATSGASSASQRKRLLHDLLARATPTEREFLVALLLGNLRQGALEGLVVEALAKAAQRPVEEVRRALMLCGSLPQVAEAAMEADGEGLAAFSLQLFRPLQPMLAQPAEDVDDALDRLGRAAFEWKLDGARIQVHKQDDDVRIYTRSLNDVTAAVPEVVAAVAGLPARQLVLDGEAIALRPDGWPQPFQVTMRRFGRKLEVERQRQELPLHAYFFDCLRLDDDDLLDRDGFDRHAALASVVPPVHATPRLVTADMAEAAAFLDQAVARGHEGVMAKALDAPYEAGRRGAAWLKVKRHNTLDLVVLAAEWGNGRRQGWLSNLHLGARDPESGGYVMLGKTFKGMTDEMLAWQTQRLLELEVARDRNTVYVRPELVVEIACNEVQASSRYPAGLALRFARVKRYRSDKRAEEADTVGSVREIFERQANSGA